MANQTPEDWVPAALVSALTLAVLTHHFRCRLAADRWNLAREDPKEALQPPGRGQLGSWGRGFCPSSGGCGPATDGAGRGYLCEVPRQLRHWRRRRAPIGCGVLAFRAGAAGETADGRGSGLPVGSLERDARPAGFCHADAHTHALHRASRSVGCSSSPHRAIGAFCAVHRSAGAPAAWETPPPGARNLEAERTCPRASECPRVICGPPWRLRGIVPAEAWSAELPRRASATPHVQNGRGHWRSGANPHPDRHRPHVLPRVVLGLGRGHGAGGHRSTQSRVLVVGRGSGTGGGMAESVNRQRPDRRSHTTTDPAARCRSVAAGAGHGSVAVQASTAIECRPAVRGDRSQPAVRPPVHAHHRSRGRGCGRSDRDNGGLQ